MGLSCVSMVLCVICVHGFIYQINGIYFPSCPATVWNMANIYGIFNDFLTLMSFLFFAPQLAYSQSYIFVNTTYGTVQGRIQTENAKGIV